MREISKIENDSSLLKCGLLTSSVEDGGGVIIGGRHRLFPSVLSLCLIKFVIRGLLNLA